MITEAPARITLEQVTAAPWRYDSYQWRIVHGVHIPHICEISPMQVGMMSARQKVRHQTERSAQWAASAESANDWRTAVIAAYRAGQWDWRTSTDCHEEAKRAAIHADIADDKQAKEDRFKRLNALNTAHDAQVGDIVHNVIFYGRITKASAKSVRMTCPHIRDGGEYKASRTQLFWLSYSDLKAQADAGAETITRKTSC